MNHKQKCNNKINKKQNIEKKNFLHFLIQFYMDGQILIKNCYFASIIFQFYSILPVPSKLQNYNKNSIKKKSIFVCGSIGQNTGFVLLLCVSHSIYLMNEMKIFWKDVDRNKMKIFSIFTKNKRYVYYVK